MTPADAFACFWGIPERVEPLGAGHINLTALVEEGGQRWVLQRLNRHVFTEPRQVMHNIDRVLAHTGGAGLPELRPTRDGQTWGERDEELWRVWRYVAHSVARKAPENSRQAVAAGATYGRFQHTLADLPPPALAPSIPGFHQLEHFLKRFDDLCVNTDWSPLIDAARPLASLFSRVTGHVHGDCKFENLLFESGTDRVLAIIDLDTVMAGHWAIDWGDLVRSLFVTQGEPEPDLFKALLTGFMPYLPQPTIDELVLAPRLVASTLGIRYLTDHAEGDVWFRVEQRGDNLARAARQFRFVARCMALENDMRQWAAQTLAGP